MAYKLKVNLNRDLRDWMQWFINFFYCSNDNGPILTQNVRDQVIKKVSHFLEFVLTTSADIPKKNAQTIC